MPKKRTELPASFYQWAAAAGDPGGSGFLAGGPMPGVAASLLGTVVGQRDDAPAETHSLVWNGASAVGRVSPPSPGWLAGRAA